MTHLGGSIWRSRVKSSVKVPGGARVKFTLVRLSLAIQGFLSMPNTGQPHRCKEGLPVHRMAHLSTLRCLKVLVNLRTLFAAEVFVWTYLALLLALWFTIRCYGDVAWLPTLLLFGPRWLYATPLAFFLGALLLTPLARFRRRLMWGQQTEVGSQRSEGGVKLACGLPDEVSFMARRGSLLIAIVTTRRGLRKAGLLLSLLLAGLILWFPIMGYCLPWQKLLAKAEGRLVRLVTCNLQGSPVAFGGAAGR